MVNTGYGIVKCNKCHKGCMVKTAVNRNNKKEIDVIKSRCDHFEMRISIYTNSNYVAWIAGERDRISFYLYAKCLHCQKMLKSETTKEGFDTGESELHENCCGSSVMFEYNYSQSIFDDNIVNITRSVVPLGGLIPNLAPREEKNLLAQEF